MAKQEDMADSSANQAQVTVNMSGTSVLPPAEAGPNPNPNSSANANANGGGGASGSSHPPLQSTVFIHKLYNILEDDDLKDLIWWSPSGLSFLIRPSEKFSRALATYFKHTNIASFVRQLNMYGFHKVSNDHCKSTEIDSGGNNNSNINDNSNISNNSNSNTDNSNSNNANSNSSTTDGQEDIKIWKFRHSTGLFKRGDIEGLKYIKRRSSRNISNSNVRKNSNPGGNINNLSPSINATNNGSNDANITSSSVTGTFGNIQTYGEEQDQQLRHSQSQHHIPHPQQPPVQPLSHPQQLNLQQQQQQQQQQQLQQSQPQLQSQQQPQQPQQPQQQHHHQQQQQPQQPQPQQHQQQQHQRSVGSESESFFPAYSSQIQPPLAYTSFPAHSTTAVPAPPAPASSDPYLEARYAELSQSYNVLRYEYNSLQYRHDEVLDQLRGVNRDMVHLLELLESLVTIQSNSESSSQGLSGLEQELVRFKTLIMGRMHRNSDVQTQPSSQKHFFENRPLSSLSVPTSQSNVPSLLQHVFAVPARPSSTANVVQQAPATGSAPSATPPQAADHFAGPRMMTMNPFETTSHHSKRNMSILMDPLAPAPNLMVGMSSSNPPQSLMNASSAPISGSNYRAPRHTDRNSKISVLGHKNSQTSNYSESTSSGSSSFSYPQVVTAGTSAGQGMGVSAGVAPIKEEQQVMTIAEPPWPPSAKEQGDIVRPIPTRSAGPPDNNRGSSGVYSLLNDERPASSLDDQMTPTKRAKY